MINEMIPEMITIKETATRTGLSYEFIRKLCINNEIIHVRTGKRYLVNFNRFIDYLNEGSIKK